MFKTEFMGAVPYSDELFYPILFGCAITVILFPLIGPLHQSAFNVYYRFVLIFFAQHVQSAMIQSTNDFVFVVIIMAAPTASQMHFWEDFLIT